MKESLLIISIMLIGSVTGTLYSVSPDFTISYQKQGNQLAHAYYDLKINSEGWNYLNVYANGEKTLLEQHRGAGFLQGYVSYKEIYYAYVNYNKQILKGQSLKPQIQSFINQQLDYIEKMIDNHPKDLYWQYAQAYIEQLRFMYRGFLTRLHTQNRLDLYIGFSEFYTLTNVGDLQDLIPAFSASQNIEKINPNLQKQQMLLGNCNGFAKLINGSIYSGHSTHNHYTFLLRIYKSFNFPTRNPQVGAKTLTFSSRPGDLISKDDFYVLDSGLVVMQSTLQNFNTANYKDLSPSTVPTWLRQTIACNLAKTSTEWVDYFLKERSGTHNNQWIIIDESKLSSKKNAIVFVQDGFSQFQVLDMTERFLQQGYIATYNVPVSQKIYKKLGFQKYPYDYDHDPRGQIYQKYNSKMQSQQDMKKWLLTNQCQDVTVGLAPRYDLSDNASKKSPFGLTDCKVVSANTLKNNFIWAYSGPTMSNGRFTPFNWSQWQNISHLGMPSEYNFDWIKFYIVYGDDDYTKEQNILLAQQ